MPVLCFACIPVNSVVEMFGVPMLQFRVFPFVSGIYVLHVIAMLGKYVLIALKPMANPLT